MSKNNAPKTRPNAAMSNQTRKALPIELISHIKGVPVGVPAGDADANKLGMPTG